MITGFATAEGTRRYAAGHPDLTYRGMGATGLLVSEAGFGGYRIDIAVESHRQALAAALRAGINLIDTSANYADGGSERLIGAVLAELITRGELTREAVVLVSKAGYLQGENYRLSQLRKRVGNPFPELVEFDQGLEHCIHPEFLADQLTRSLQRLGVERLDGYLLHNPEYYLKWARVQEIPLEEARTDYLRRIRAAFRYLESEVDRGRIGCYGISSNTFPAPAEDFDFTPLAAIWAVADALTPGHHFRLIECPCNLFEPGAVTEENQPGGRTVLDVARDTNLAVLINRPLNAIQGDQLVRLAENVYQGEAAEHAVDFRERVAGLDPDWRVASLSHLAVRALRSTRGITSVLVGMRRREYVEDVLHELRQPCAPADRRAAWEALAE
jgi:aryl-alcohol dehydrogenase-like predicted oxidoreductase